MSASLSAAGNKEAVPAVAGVPASAFGPALSEGAVGEVAAHARRRLLLSPAEASVDVEIAPSGRNPERENRSTDSNEMPWETWRGLTPNNLNAIYLGEREPSLELDWSTRIFGEEVTGVACSWRSADYLGYISR